MQSPPNGPVLSRWFLTVGASIIVLLFGVLMTILSQFGARLGVLETQTAVMQERSRQIETLVEMTRREQVERTARFADITNRLNLLERAVTPGTPR